MATHVRTQQGMNEVPSPHNLGRACVLERKWENSRWLIRNVMRWVRSCRNAKTRIRGLAYSRTYVEFIVSAALV